MDWSALKKRVFLSAVLFACVASFGTAAADSGKKWGGAKGDGYAGVDPKTIEKARSNYGLHCAPCHGEHGDGKGPTAAALTKPPRDHTDKKYMSSRTDDQLFKVVSEGGSAFGLDENMPPFNTLMSKEEIKGIIAYLRQLCGCVYTK